METEHKEQKYQDEMFPENKLLLKLFANYYCKVFDSAASS